jgi:ATP-binding protein involved in chromosome partitioning
MEIRETSDTGRPIVVSNPQSIHAAVYREIATRVWNGITRERAEGGRTPPKIVIE